MGPKCLQMLNKENSTAINDMDTLQKKDVHKATTNCKTVLKRTDVLKVF